jgi:hypothetical protein
VIDIAKIDNLEKAPPEIMLINPVIPDDDVSPNWLTASKLTIGIVIKQPILKIINSNNV